MISFFDRAYAVKVKRQAEPRSKAARAARALAKANQQAVAKAKKEPLDASRPIPQGLRLFVIRVASQREFEAARALEDMGWFTITPLRRDSALKSAKRGGKREPRNTVIRPQLAGYMLAGFPRAPNWYSFEGNKLVFGPINRNGVPLQLSEKQIERFQVEASKIVMVESLKKGSRVRLTEGPFAGHECDITRIKGGVATVLKYIFGADHEMNVPVESLEAVGQKAA